MTAETAGFIAAQRTGHGVPHAVACRALEVPEPVLQASQPALTGRQLRRRAIGAEVDRALGESQGAYGSPRVTAQLRRDGIAVSKKTVEASMARQGLRARPKPKKRGLTGQNPANVAAEDLLRRGFGAKAINQKQFGGFKEVKTAQGPVFAATVLDLCSRRIAGFATSGHYPTAELAEAAVNTAVATRGGDIDGVVFHSDKGPQYTAKAFAEACRRLGIARSTGRTGNALDNAPAESFFSTLQHEPIDQCSWATKAQARQEITQWVHDWHNQHRLHSAIGMAPPVEYEHAHTPNPHNQPL